MQYIKPQKNPKNKGGRVIRQMMTNTNETFKTNDRNSVFLQIEKSGLKYLFKTFASKSFSN